MLTLNGRKGGGEIGKSKEAHADSLFWSGRGD